MDFNFRDFIILLTLVIITGCLIYYFRTINIITENDANMMINYVRIPTVHDIINSTMSTITPSSLKMILSEVSKVTPEYIQVDCHQYAGNVLNIANQQKIKSPVISNSRQINPETLPYDKIPIPCSEIQFDESQINYFFPKSFMMLN